MRLNTFMIITAFVIFIFGLGFIVAPAAVMSLYENTLNGAGEYVGRYFGSALIGMAVIAWFTRNTSASDARKGVLTGFFVAMLLGFLLALYDGIAGTGNVVLWLNVVIYLLLAIGFGYFAFIKKD